MRRWTWLIPLLLAGIVHAPALWGDFVWDDAPLIVENRLVQDPSELATVLTSSFWETGDRHDRFRAFFRPVIASSERRDKELHLMLTRYNLAHTYEDAYAHTHEEARRMTAEGRYDGLLKDVVSKYRELESRCDFVLCEGTDFTRVSSAFEFEFNADVANNLGSPVLAMVSGAIDEEPWGESGAQPRLDYPYLVKAEGLQDGQPINSLPAEQTGGGYVVTTDPTGASPGLVMVTPPPSTAPYPSQILTLNRFSKASHRLAGQAAECTILTGFSPSLGCSGCFIRIGIMAPMALNWVAP